MGENVRRKGDVKRGRAAWEWAKSSCRLSDVIFCSAFMYNFIFMSLAVKNGQQAVLLGGGVGDVFMPLMLIYGAKAGKR